MLGASDKKNTFEKYMLVLKIHNSFATSCPSSVTNSLRQMIEMPSLVNWGFPASSATVLDSQDFTVMTNCPAHVTMSPMSAIH